MRSDKAGAFRASNTDLIELENPSLRLEGPSLTLDNPSPFESAMWYTRSRYHAGSNSVRMRNTHYVIYFATSSVDARHLGASLSEQ